MSRIDPISRFSEPPAPPPQQPLPEKPDVARRAAQDLTPGGLKRSDTEKPPKDTTANSPVSKESSQILSLIEALSLTKKELDAQNTRVKELEELLKQERQARESAEEKSQESRFHAVTEEKGMANTAATSEQPGAETTEALLSEVEEITKPDEIPGTNVNADVSESKNVEEPVLDAQTLRLQQRLDNMVMELAEMKQQVETFKQRAEKAEGENVEARKSLAEMIESIRNQREVAQDKGLSHDDEVAVTESLSICKSNDTEIPATTRKLHDRTNSRNINELDNAVSSLTQQRKQNMLENSTPYASMVGVVLLGIGLMAYLNGWQKIER